MSTKLKHTPGPWQFTGQHTKKKMRWLLDNRVDGQKGTSVMYHVAYWDITEQDRKLIAAAPDLLRCCIEQKKLMDKAGIIAPELDTAIKKATL